jgi:phosphate butyryltransferase
MADGIRTFSDIYRHAVGLYAGSPLHVLVTPVRYPKMLDVLKEAETEGWITLSQIGKPKPDGQFDQISLEEATKQLASGEGEVLLSDTLDPKPLLATLLRKDLGLRQENEVWSHTAVFEWQTPPRWLLVSDGVLVTRPDLLRRLGVINNAIYLARCLGVQNPKVALLAASRAIQPDVHTSREWTWVSKMAQRRIFRGARVCGPVGLEEAIRPTTPEAMNHPCFGQDASNGAYWADVLITADISVANPLVSALALLCRFPCAGVVVGGKVPVIFPWPSIDKVSVLTSLALAAICSPRGRRRLREDESNSN